MNKNMKRAFVSLIILIVLIIAMILVSAIQVKGLAGLEKAGWFTLFFVSSIIDSIVLFVNVIICIVAPRDGESNE